MHFFAEIQLRPVENKLVINVIKLRSRFASAKSMSYMTLDRFDMFQINQYNSSRIKNGVARTKNSALLFLTAEMNARVTIGRYMGIHSVDAFGLSQVDCQPCMVMSH